MLGQRPGADRQRGPPVHAVRRGADDELGGPTAHVDDPEPATARRRRGLEHGGRAAEGQPRLVLAGDDLPPQASLSGDRLHQGGPVGGRADRGGGHAANVLCPMLSGDGDLTEDDGDHLVDLVGGDDSPRGESLADPREGTLLVNLDERPVDGFRDEQAGGVGADIDAGGAHAHRTVHYTSDLPRGRAASSAETSTAGGRSFRVAGALRKAMGTATANRSDPTEATPKAVRDDANCAIRPPATMPTPGASMESESERLISSAIHRSGVRSWMAVRHATHSTLLPAPARTAPHNARISVGAAASTAKPT